MRVGIKGGSAPIRPKAFSPKPHMVAGSTPAVLKAPSLGRRVIPQPGVRDYGKSDPLSSKVGFGNTGMTGES